MAKGKFEKKQATGKKNKKSLMAIVLIVVIVAVAVVGIAFYCEYVSSAQSVSDAAAPWEMAFAKKPKNYSYEEFQALTPEQQILFQRAFATEADFVAWLEREGPSTPTEADLIIALPWETAGAKQPSDYSWEEFKSLDAAVQIAFQKEFASQSEFEAWMQKVNPVEPTETTEAMMLPWETSGKSLSDYTWDEYNQWDIDIQMAFQNAFKDASEFQKWMDKVHPVETQGQQKSYPFTTGERNPAEYTWDEFQNMTAEEQMAFQNSFLNKQAFEDWMTATNPEGQLSTEDLPWEVPGAKQPEDYTWEEFESLTAAQQIAFQSAFEDQDGFTLWLDKVHS